MSCNEAHTKSLDMVGYTCGPVKDVLVHLKDKYSMSDDDFSFAFTIITEQTKRLRKALVREIEKNAYSE